LRRRNNILKKNQEKVEITGTPIRQELFKGSKEAGLAFCGFKAAKPCLLVIGGSQGSMKLNKVVREALPSLSEQYQIIHLCGKGKLDTNLLNQADYCQLEYANKELADLLAATDIVVSRAGANSVYEILALQKPHVLIPLSLQVSRGDQIQNARYFQKLGLSQVLDDDTLTVEQFLQAINQVSQQKDEIVRKIKELNIESATQKIVALIKEQMHVESPKAV
jgi:UDP-N-acetylglucosamine--N-acetylmuramyl-(pentapeptide) pyrophosphoryl-undecaprenol N-acetylglucosamine transferase